MRLERSVLWVIALASIATGTSAQAQTPTSNTVIYQLARESDFEWGCFAPCVCPVLVREPMLGTFELTRVASDPLFDYYDVTNVRWKLPNSPTAVSIVGSGKYRRGGEVALEEQLTLDLSVNGGEPQHFDSGLVPPHASFPEISTTISLHGQYCFDTVMIVVAKPAGVAGVDAGSVALSLSATPSPFRGSTDVQFSLARAGRVDLGIFDVTGREARSLAHAELVAAGRFRRTWDGLLAGGAAAPPGLYFVRLATADGLRSVPIVKLR